MRDHYDHHDPVFEAVRAAYDREDAAQQKRIDAQFVRRPEDEQDSAMAVQWGLDVPVKRLSDAEYARLERERAALR